TTFPDGISSERVRKLYFGGVNHEDSENCWYRRCCPRGGGARSVDCPNGPRPRAGGAGGVGADWSWGGGVGNRTVSSGRGVSRRDVRQAPRSCRRGRRRCPHRQSGGEGRIQVR